MSCHEFPILYICTGSSLNDLFWALRFCRRRGEALLEVEDLSMAHDWEPAIVAAASALVSFWLLVVLRTLARTHPRVVLHMAAVRWSTCWKMCSNQQAHKSSDSFARNRAGGKIMLQRLRNARTINCFFCLVCTCVVSFNGLSAFQGSRTYDLETQIAHDLVVFLTTCIVTANHFIPSLVNHRTLPVWHSVLFCLFFVFAIFMAKNLDADWFVLSGPRMLFVRLIFGLYYSALVPAMFWNILYSVFTWIVLISRGSEYEESGGTLALFSLELIDCVFAVVLTYIFEILQVSRVCSEIEAQSSLRSKDTAERLLSVLCDAVVNVGPKLEIVQPCLKLDAILSRQCVSFDLAIHASDRERFSEFLKSVVLPASKLAGSAEAAASSLHLHLCDAHGRQIPVQIFMVSCYDSREMLCYIMGIKEEASFACSSQTPDAQNGGDTAMLMHVKDAADYNLERDTRAALKKSPDALEGTRSGGSSSTMETVSVSNSTDGVWFILQPFSFTVVEAAPTLIALTGPSIVGADLEAWIADAEKFLSLTRFIQNMVNSHMNEGVGASTIAQEFGQVKFTPLPGFRCRALWTLKIIHSDSDSVNVSVVLTNVRVGSCRKASSRRHGISSSRRIGSSGASSCPILAL